MIDSSLAPLQAALRDTADLTYDQARSMPGTFYTDPSILALEREQLFMREWICVGRQEEVAAPGDFMAVRICDEPVVVVHGRDGVIRALSNVCRHRGTVMASGRGNKQRIVCPYHHWTYDDAGRLIGAPRMAKRPDFDPASCRLPEFACTIWQGFVFVSLAADPPALAPRLAALEDMIRPYHLEQAVLRYVGRRGLADQLEMHAGEFHGGLSSLGPPSPDPAQGQSDQALPPLPAGRGLFRLSRRLLSGPAALPERPSRAFQQPARRLRHARRAARAGRGLCQRLQLLHLHPARIRSTGCG